MTGAGLPSSSLTSGASSAAAALNADEDPMSAVNALAARTTTHDGLSAVERAKKTAEDFTISQLAKRKRKATSPQVTASLSDDDGVEEDGGGAERQSHRKYQKRLQKNRDSAFVSRIRRREYTRILENSLSSVEKEKDAAVAAFREMKRRFDVVSAELAGIKTAAASNFAGIRDAIINRVTVPDVPHGLFVPPQNVGFHPGYNYNGQKSSMPFPNYNQNNFNAVEMNRLPFEETGGHLGMGNAGSGTGYKPVMTTMYMVALVVGVLLPEYSSRRTTGVETIRRENGNLNSTTAEIVGRLTGRSGKRNEHSAVGNGRIWSRHGHAASEHVTGDVNNNSYEMAEQVIEDVRVNAVQRLGEETADRVLIALHRHLEVLAVDEIEEIVRSMQSESDYTGFEALLRAVIRDDGGDVADDSQLDDMVSQVAGLNFEDRL